jgi:hypothetical protein
MIEVDQKRPGFDLRFRFCNSNSYAKVAPSQHLQYPLWSRSPAALAAGQISTASRPVACTCVQEVVATKSNLKILPLIALTATFCMTGALAQQSQPKPIMPSGVARSAMPGSGMDMANMKSDMEKMRAQMEQVQALMKDSMAKMAAADAAMQTHMETMKDSMKTQMALQQAMIDHAQTMTDHMLAMSEHMAMMPASMDMPKKDGMPMKQDEQKK